MIGADEFIMAIRQTHLCGCKDVYSIKCRYFLKPGACQESVTLKVNQLQKIPYHYFTSFCSWTRLTSVSIEYLCRLPQQWVIDLFSQQSCLVY